MNHAINITVTGSNEQHREAVSSVVTHALSEQGFSNVAMVTPAGEPMVAKAVPSCMDVIREQHPNFMVSPIHIYSLPTIGDTAEINLVTDGQKVVCIEDDDATLIAISTKAVAA